MTRALAELDEVARLTTRRSWTALLAVLTIFGALAGWGLLARVESTVRLDGLLVAGTGPTVLTAPAGGTVVALSRPVGGRVAAGDDVVVLEVAGVRRVVASPVRGAVSSVAVRPSAVVESGQPLATVEPVGARLGAVLLFDADRPPTVPPGATVRGGGFTGRVTGLDPYPVTVDDLAARLGRASLPGDGRRLVRVLHVDLGVPAWAGATLTPVRMDLVLGEQSPADLLWHGGA